MSNTDTQNTNTPNAATLLEFANLQVAAEALYNKENLTEFKIDDLEYLINGNNRTSKFTAIQAEEFAQKWEIVSHVANTSTGFSGTPSRQLKILRDWCGT